jgi:iron complex outermembrane recepter protein
MRASLKFASSLAIVVATAASGTAFAQASDAPVASDDQGLAEIIVTAQKREENLQRAAISVTAVTGESLTRQGVSDVTQLQTLVPAIQIGSSYGGGSQYTLRGVGNVVLNTNSDTAVITNLDGVPIARATSVQGLFYDLERVEVLKGPQGTLYGRNATGGAVNIITAKPRLGETSGYFNAAYGNYDALSLGAAVNLPIGESAALRVAGTLNQHDGYFTDGSGDERLRAVRATLRAELSDSITLTIGGDYAQQGGIGMGATVFGDRKDERIGVLDPRTDPVIAGTFSIPAFSFLRPLPTLSTLSPRQDNQMWGISANLDVDTSIGTLTVLPSYRKTNLDFITASNAFWTAIEETDEQKSLEVRLVSPSENRLQYIVGAFYMEEDNLSRVAFNQQYFGAYGTFGPTSKAYAGYARLTYKVTPAFRVSLAGRYTSDKRRSVQRITNGLTLCTTEPPVAPPGPGNSPCIGSPSFPFNGITPPPGFPAPGSGPVPPTFYPSGGITTFSNTPFDQEETFNKFNWRAGIEYDVGPQSLFYATVETGFKAGGFYNSTNPDSSFGPEDVMSYTIGLKNRFLDNRIQVNIEGFWMEYKDKQFSRIATMPDGTTAFATFNVGKSRSRGVELDVLGKATENTTLNLNVQYLDAEETDFSYPAFGAPPATGCGVTGTGPGAFRVDCSGQTSVNSPEWTINAGIEQAFPLANGGDIKFRAQTRYQSEAQTSYDFQPGGLQSGYWMSDIYLTYEAPEQQYYITGFISNIEDTAAATYTQAVPNGSIAPGSTQPLFRISLTPPRTYGVRVGVKF